MDYNWPGNVRELRIQTEYAFAVGEGPVFGITDLTPELRGEGPAVPPGQMTSEDLERKQIIDALETAGGHKAKAAELLNMSRSTHWRKIRELHIHSCSIAGQVSRSCKICRARREICRFSGCRVGETFGTMRSAKVRQH
ncbi:MAG: helix-turn-helix domain-containing protein [Hyphomicrobium sp.]